MSFLDQYSSVTSHLVYDKSVSNTPLLSFLIPTYKRPEKLRRALHSVAEQNLQIPYEIIVVGNHAGEREKLESLCEEFSELPMKVFVNDENIGMFGNWNRALSLSSANYFTLLNDDDKLAPNWKKLIELISGPSFVSCQGVPPEAASDLHQDEKAMQDIDVKKYQTVSESMLFLGLWTNGTLGTIFDTSAALETGGFDEAFFPISDWDFYIRYYKKFGGIRCNENLAVYEVRDNEAVKEETIINSIKLSYNYRLQMVEGYAPVGKFIFKFATRVVRSKKISWAPMSNPDLSEQQAAHLCSVSMVEVSILRWVPIRLLRWLCKNFYPQEESSRTDCIN